MTDQGTGADADSEADGDGDDAGVVTWTAVRGTAWSAASTLTALELRSGRFLVFAAVLVAGLPLLFARVAHDGPAFGAIMGFVIGAFVVACSTAISAWSRLQRFRRTFAPGTETRCRFEPDRIVFLGDYSESSIQLNGFDRLREVGDWLLVKRRGARGQYLLHRDLFPPDDLARLRMVVLGVAEETGQ